MLAAFGKTAGDTAGNEASSKSTADDAQKAADSSGPAASHAAAAPSPGPDGSQSEGPTAQNYPPKKRKDVQRLWADLNYSGEEDFIATVALSEVLDAAWDSGNAMRLHTKHALREDNRGMELNLLWDASSKSHENSSWPIDYRHTDSCEEHVNQRHAAC